MDGSYEVERDVRELGGEGGYGPGRGSFKKKVPEVGKTQGVFFSRQRHLKLEKTEENGKHDLLESIINSNYRHYQSVQFSCSAVFDSLQPHGLRHARPPCPSPTPRA